VSWAVPPSFEHRPAGGARVYDIDVTPIEQDGAVVGGLAVGRDITERKQMERALAHSARELRDLAAQASDVVARSDEGAVYTYVSPACARVYGFEPEQMVGRPVFDFVHPDDHAAHRALREALAGGSDEELAERRMKIGGGDWPWVETRCRALRDDDGRFVGVQSSARDITDRKAADEQFRTAFDDALIGIALVALDGRWLRVNESLCEIVGRGRDELYGMTFQDITHPEDPQRPAAPERRHRPPRRRRVRRPAADDGRPGRRHHRRSVPRRSGDVRGQAR
jgi:PAS domain S-box-containing protein